MGESNAGLGPAKRKRESSRHAVEKRGRKKRIRAKELMRARARG
jgi:hypothetical protein